MYHVRMQCFLYQILTYLLFSTAKATSTQLLDLLDQKIYINLASHINYRLGEDLSAFGDDVFIFYNYLHFKLETKYIGISKIEKDDDQYRIQIGSQYLCSENNQLVKCKNNEYYWSIKLSDYGYTISNNKMCITTEKGLTLEECRNSPYQQFVFELRPAIYDCLDDITSLIEKSYTDNDEKNKKLIRDAINSQNLDYEDDVIDTIKEKIENKKNAKKFIENQVPEAKGSKKMERVIEALHENTWNWEWLHIALDYLMNFFCPSD